MENQLQIWQEPSGLEVVCQPNEAANVVAIQIWVKTGSSHETDAQAGISHFIEHMVFKGTSHFGPGEIAKAIEAKGGTINAYTSFDYTVFYVVMPANNWQLGLQVLAEMVQHAVFDPIELESERQVVLEEIRRDQDSPFYILSDALFATAYKRYPYRRPIIGYVKTVKGLKREDLLAYYRHWYRLSNMVLVVAGKIKPTSLKRAIAKCFQSSYQPKPEFTPPQEPVQRRPRVKLLKRPFQQAYLALAFPIPGLGHADVYPLDILAEVLGQGNSSRLNLELRLKKALVHSISANAFTPMGPGIFSIQAICEPPKVQPALEAILAEVQRIKTQGITSLELEKARLSLESDFIYDQETMEGWARTLGSFQVTEGHALKYREYLQKIAAVTPNQVKTVAQKYLVPERLSLVLVSSSEMEDFSPSNLKALWPVPSKVTADSSIHRFVLNNGLKLIIKEDHRLPTFALSLIWLGGLRAETDKTNGICNLIAKMLTRGTLRLPAPAIALKLDQMACNLEGFSGWNTLGLSGNGLSRFFSDFLELLAEIVHTPAFAESELMKVKSLVLATIKQKEDRPAALAVSEFYQALFKGHPYGWDILGTPQIVNHLSAQDLKAFYKKIAVPNNAVITVVGDVATHEAYELINRLFGGWPQSNYQLPEVSLPTRLSQRLVVKRPLKREQVHFVIGNLGPSIYQDKAKCAMALLDAILSGQGGRLFVNLRDKKGLAYALSFLHREGLDTGAWAVYMATGKERLDEALKGVRRELNRLKSKGIGLRELNRAKEYVLGNLDISLQTPSSQALSLGLNELYGLGYGYDERYRQQIKEMTLKEVETAIETYIHSEAGVLALVGPVD